MLITYIIPVFNERKTVEKSIQDIIDLKLEKEIIIIDNNSTDGSKEIIKKFENKKNIIIYEKNKNLGFGHSIQKGFEISSGEYIFIQYADLEYDHLSSIEMLKSAQNENIDVIFASRLITKLYNRSKLIDFVPKNNGQGFDFEFVSIICKKKFKIKEMKINYVPRTNSSEKKIKFYHMFNAIYEIFKVKFFK